MIETTPRITVVTLLLTVLLITSSALAQTASAGAPSCGDPNTEFKVKTDMEQRHPQPDSGKALVYFIQNDLEFESRPRPTTRMGMDGHWVGATHSNSCIHVPVDPGMHHLCASWQGQDENQEAAAAHFTAEAGGVYYFQVKNKFLRVNGSRIISLTPLDSDEGQLPADKFSLATSQPKK